MNPNELRLRIFSGAVCRTCLKTEDQFSPLLDSGAAEMLRDCNFCGFSEKDDLPKQICSACLDMLQKCYSFKKLCRSSELALRQCLQETEKVSFLNRVEIQDNSVDSCDLREELGSDVIKPSTECEDLISFLEKPLPPPLPHQCEHCNHSYSEENDLKIHQSVHNSDLICLGCSKRFSGRQTLKRHLKIHLIQKPHVCKICAKSFPESYALVKHLRHHSGIPREKRHFCDECGQGFSEPYYLKVHLRKHTGERPLACPHCHKSFADPRSYKTHCMIHNGEKPFKCNFCHKGFTQSANLKKHLRVHTGEKPYSCLVCDKKFTQSSSLDKHARTHKVRVCERFGEKSDLKKHG